MDTQLIFYPKCKILKKKLMQMLHLMLKNEKKKNTKINNYRK